MIAAVTLAPGWPGGRRSPPLGVLIVTVVRPAFVAFQVVPGGLSVTCVAPTVNVAGMAIRTQPRSCSPSGPPRFQNVALIVVAWRASIVDGVSVIVQVEAAAGQVPR